MEGLAFRERQARAENATSSTQAWDLGTNWAPRSMSLAGADLAVGGGVTAALGNPAALNVSRGYELELMGNWMPEAGYSQYGGAIADSVTSRMAGAFAGQWTNFDTDRLQRSALDLRASTAYPLGDAFSVGVAARYLRTTDRLGSGATAGDPVAANDGERTRLSFDAGLVFLPAPGFHVGLLARNIFVPATFDLPRVYAAGVGLGFEGLSIESTALVNTTTASAPLWRSSTGVEWTASERYALRLGYRFDEERRTHALGLGVAILDRAGALEVGVRRDISGPYPATFIAVGIRALMGAVGNTDSDIGM
jgi:hypothetical protein